jgi:hypothetical protein
MAETKSTTKTKLFFDLEFSGLHKLTTAISIGIVAEDGRKYYAEFTDFDKYQIDDFLRKTVLPKRILGEYNFETDYDPKAETVLVKGDIDVVYSTLLEWLKPYEENGVEMWGDLLSYDWVLFINIFGNGLALPKFIDYIPMDLCTALPLMGEKKDVDRDIFAYGEEVAKSKKANKHNSLYDAETQLEVYKKLVQKISKPAEEEEQEDEEGEDAEKIDSPIDKQLKDAKDLVEESNTEEAVIEEVIHDNNQEIKEETVPPIKKIVEAEIPKKKRGRGRPKKNVEIEELDTKKVDFIEPTAAEVNSTKEWETPLG